MPGISMSYVRIGRNELAGPARRLRVLFDYSAALVVFAAAQNTNLPCSAIDAGLVASARQPTRWLPHLPVRLPTTISLYPQLGAFLCRFGYEIFHGFTYIGIGTGACFVLVR